MNNTLKQILEKKYVNFAMPKKELTFLGVDLDELEKLVESSSSYILSGLGEIPVYIHKTVIKLMTIGIFQVDIAESNDIVAVEYNSSVNENSAIAIYKEKTSSKICEILTHNVDGEEAFSYEWLAALFVGVINTKEKLSSLIKFTNLSRGKADGTITDKNELKKITSLYFELVECFIETIFSLDEPQMFLNGLSLKTIDEEYVKNTTDFDSLVPIFSAQGLFIQEANCEYFKFFPVKTKVEVSADKAKKLANDFDFTITGSRRFDENEQEMMANTEIRMQNYIPTQIAIDMVTAFYATNKCSFGAPLRAAMLYGPSGTGKTEMVQYLGYKLGLPVTTFSCSANTDENDLLSKPISLGISGGGDGKIVYTETELTKAIKNGWIIEIQEASVVKETAVHQIFNSLFDGTELIQLPDGSMITPHPNFIAVFTTNVSYEGCNAMNQSLISRNQFVAEVHLPTEEETIERLKKQLNWSIKKSDEPVKIAVTCMNKINAFLQEESIDDGSCDFRAIKDWLQMYLAFNEVGIKKSMLELANYCIVPKSTLDSNYHDDIRAICEGIIPAI